GCGLLMLSLLIVFALIYRSLAKSIKPYFASLIAGFLIYSFSDNTLSTVQMIIPFCWYLNALYQTSTQTDFRKEK
ncbi:O-antigen ligase family protein, partial [Paenibacillus sp. OT2-17]|nr:O-antigen ligase family protein [Paenibacillus sp. OT2-17]